MAAILSRPQWVNSPWPDNANVIENWVIINVDKGTKPLPKPMFTIKKNPEIMRIWWHHNIYGLVQDCSDSSALAVELLQSWGGGY